ncbi:acyltransferase [Ruminococcus sp.]|uniref:acyltransferase family protein n=1 Tax=Ruminococcus sp. TaxID=41978 RepID=UPI0025FE9073|nr:acyltransferase [Ruminococcus sp.]MBQ9541247.1 acyltransferase [Ruminococcus sp.]
MPKQNKEYCYSIDAAKFICALLVVAEHCVPFGYSEAFIIPNQILRNFIGRLAVPFFYVSSGFFFFKSNYFYNYDIKKVKKYVSRLLFLYVVWCLLYFPLHISSILHDPNGITFGVLNYIRAFLFEGGHPHLWYLRSLAVSIIIVSAMIKKKFSMEKIFMISLAAYLVGLLGQGYTFLLEPLKKYDIMWDLLAYIKLIIGTTRNGVFEGLLFISMSLILSEHRHEYSKKLSIPLFTVSMAAFGAELLFLHRKGISLENDYSLFLFPAVFFLFQFVLSIKTEPSSKYKMLRKTSSVIYFTHPLVHNLMRSALLRFKAGLTRTSVLFILTEVGSIALAYSAVKLSEIKWLKWTKKLY